MVTVREAATPPPVTGAEYEAHLSRRVSDRRAREAFCDLVVSLAAPGATLLDFGSGTGIDARFYAARGFIVRAYDVDADMCDYFEAHSRQEIQEGRIMLLRGGYRSFLQQCTSAQSRVDLVTANFAPLSLIENLHELFAKFHALTVPGGKVLASVLCPYFLGDTRYGWWWRTLTRLIGRGHYSVGGAHGPIVRRRLTDFALQAAPYSTLQRVFQDSPPRPAQPEGRIGFPPSSSAWLRLTRCRYMFLLFTRQDASSPGH
jgi:SAM-dependent methyltransferase